MFEPMKRRLLGAALAAGALALAPAAAAPAGEAPVAQIACVKAKISGASKCIARGQYCVHNSRAERDYRRSGFSCSKRDARGRYHLQ